MMEGSSALRGAGFTLVTGTSGNSAGITASKVGLTMHQASSVGVGWKA